jgi:hypothetical protein
VLPSGRIESRLAQTLSLSRVPTNRIVLQARFLRNPFAACFDGHPVGSYLGITSLAEVVLPGAVSASAQVKLSGYSGLCAN